MTEKTAKKGSVQPEETLSVPSDYGYICFLMSPKEVLFIGFSDSKPRSGASTVLNQKPVTHELRPEVEKAIRTHLANHREYYDNEYFDGYMVETVPVTI